MMLSILFILVKKPAYFQKLTINLLLVRIEDSILILFPLHSSTEFQRSGYNNILMIVFSFKVFRV